MKRWKLLNKSQYYVVSTGNFVHVLLIVHCRLYSTVNDHVNVHFRIHVHVHVSYFCAIALLLSRVLLFSLSFLFILSHDLTVILQKVIEPEEVHKFGVSTPHTTHCLGNGDIMISTLGQFIVQSVHSSCFKLGQSTVEARCS